HAEHLDAVDFARPSEQALHAAATAGRELALQLFDLLLQAALVREQLLHLLGELSRRGPHHFGGARDRFFEIAYVGERSLAGDGDDAPHARRDALLADDLEQPDIAGGARVRAAAELAGLGHAEQTHDVAVLLLEDHHRAALLGLFQ